MIMNWIPVDCRLPEPQTEVLTAQWHYYEACPEMYREASSAFVQDSGQLIHGEWHTAAHAYNEWSPEIIVTHWMPIPDLPKGVVDPRG